MNTLYPVICSTNIEQSKEFYLNMFNFEVLYQLHWYVHLGSKSNHSVQIAFVQQDHPSVPAHYQQKAQGIFISFEFDNVNDYYNKAKKLNKVIYSLMTLVHN